jgi:hypothetical protein
MTSRLACIHATPRRARRRHGFAERLPPGQIGKIDAGERAEPDPGPEPPIDVEQLVLPVTPIMLEFDLDDAGVVH